MIDRVFCLGINSQKCPGVLLLVKNVGLNFYCQVYFVSIYVYPALSFTLLLGVLLPNIYGTVMKTKQNAEGCMVRDQMTWLLHLSPTPVRSMIQI